MKLAVVVPTYRRPESLARCLGGIARQVIAPDEVIVVIRDDDQASRHVAAGAGLDQLRVVRVTAPGQVAALNAGVRASSAHVVAITDDDAVPRPDWTQAILARFAESPQIGAVGGRDAIFQDGAWLEGRVSTVGRVGWGRAVGNHHLSAPRQDVDFLKGANLAFRRTAWRPFDTALRGDGAQVCNDLEATWSVRRRGWRVVYDPAVVVDHFPAARGGADARGRGDLGTRADEVHNQLYALLRHAGAGQALVVLLYTLLVGTRLAPGILMGLALGTPPGTLAALAASRVAAARLAVRRRRRAEGTVTFLAHEVLRDGGMENVVREAILGLLEAGATVHLYSRKCDLPHHRALHWHRVRTPSHPFLLNYPLYALVTGAALAWRRRGTVVSTGAIVPNRVDVITVHFCHASFGHQGVQRASRASLLYRLSGDVSARLARAGERWCYRPGRVTRISAVSDVVAADLSREFDLDGVPITVIPNGVDLTRFAPDPADRERTRAELDIPADTRLALFVGGDWIRKGLAPAVEGARAAGWRLLVVGRGHEEPWRDVVTDGAVRFLGHQPDPRPYFHAADAFVLPSRYEGFALVSLEAAACGLPLAVTAATGAGGLAAAMGLPLVDAEASAAGVEAVLRSIADAPDGGRILRDAARQAAGIHDWSRIRALYRDFYLGPSF